MDSVDVVVIGAGVVGLACAKHLAEAGREVIVLDQSVPPERGYALAKELLTLSLR